MSRTLMVYSHLVCDQRPRAKGKRGQKLHALVLWQCSRSGLNKRFDLAIPKTKGNILLNSQLSSLR